MSFFLGLFSILLGGMIGTLTGVYRGWGRAKIKYKKGRTVIRPKQKHLEHRTNRGPFSRRESLARTLPEPATI